MVGRNSALALALGVTMAAALAACDNGPSAVRSKSGDSAPSATASAAGPDSGYAGAGREAEPGVDHRKDAVRLVDGKPMWSPSRRYSAEESAQRAFERNGETFGARSLDDFVRKAHAFVGHPPAGVQTLTRANGDTLFYDPKANIFAVANKDGAPRTMFKPDEGAAYWDKQKARETRRQASRADRRRSADDDA